jgi:hypothetical protein
MRGGHSPVIPPFKLRYSSKYCIEIICAVLIELVGTHVLVVSFPA